MLLALSAPILTEKPLPTVQTIAKLPSIASAGQMREDPVLSDVVTS
jgi:hypothetical protein